MSTPDYDPDYPYTPQPAVLDVPTGPRKLLPWAVVWRWTKRLAIAAVTCVLLVAVSVGYVASRAWRQADSIARLKQLGCLIDYAHEEDLLEESALARDLREAFGDEVWGTVVGVRADQSFLFRGRLTADETAAICKTCRQFGSLRSFAIASDSFRIEQIADWPQLPLLQKLSIHSQALSDDDVARIGKLSQLRELELTAPRLTAASLSHLAGLTHLDSLTLRDARLGGAAPRVGQGFPELEYLTIKNATELSDEAFVSLGPLAGLNHAVLDGTTIGDRAVKHLANCQNLNLLSLVGTRVTDASLTEFRKLADRALSQLDLEGTAVTDRGLAALAGSELMSLSLDRTAVTDEGVREIAGMRGLDFLSLRDSRVTGAGVAHLRFSSLSVYLDGAPLTPEGIRALAQAKADVITVARTTFGDADLMLFANNDVLKSLDVTGAKVTEEGVRSFRTARAKRFATAGREDQLLLFSDFAEEPPADSGPGF